MHEMSDLVEISVDNRGCIILPDEVRDRLGLTPGMTLTVEEDEKGAIGLRVQKELPEIVDKQGVLVVRSEAAGDVAEAVRRERGRRLSEFMQRAGL
jgi:AbrB family looped-hinge helix DNA binding protein